MTKLAISLSVALLFSMVVDDHTATLFRDDFQATSLDNAWLLEHAQTGTGNGPPVWVHQGGVLSQTNQAFPSARRLGRHSVYLKLQAPKGSMDA